MYFLFEIYLLHSGSFFLKDLGAPLLKCNHQERWSHPTQSLWESRGPNFDKCQPQACI